MRRLYPAITQLIWLPLAFVIVGSALAQVPEKLSYQGLLTDQAGKAVQNGAYHVTFRLYTEEAGGQAVWEETQELSVLDGVFSTFLGQREALKVPFDKPYHLSIQFDGQPESPRTPLSAAPYSLLARDVADGAVVRSLSGLKDEIEIVAGEGIEISKQENKLVISARVGVANNVPAYETGELLNEGTGEVARPLFAVMGPGGSNTGLDAAYDAGRIITADGGPVEINAAGAIAFRMSAAGGTVMHALNGDLLFEDNTGGIPTFRYRVSGGAAGVQEYRFQVNGTNGRFTLRNQTLGQNPLVIFPDAVGGLLTLQGSTVVMGGLRLPAGAAAGHVLTSDASGNAAWAPGGGGGGLPGGGTVGSVLRNTGPGTGSWSSTVFINEAIPFVGVNRNSQVTGAEFFGFTAPVGAGVYGGMYANTQNAGGWPFYGYATGGVARAWTYFDGGTNKWHLYNNGSRITVQSNGNVGINEQSPDARLDVVTGAAKGIEVVTSGGSGLNTPSLRAHNTAAGSGIGAVISSAGTDASLVLGHAGSGALLKGFGANGGEDEFRFNNDGRLMMFNPSFQLAVSIDPNGTNNAGEIELFDGGVRNIEIIADEGAGLGGAIKLFANANTLTPTIELDADFGGDGRIITEELQITGGSDLSEHFEVLPAFGIAEPVPGMVVSIDPTSRGGLAISGKPYDRLVAGVISGAGGLETGLIMAQRGTPEADGEFPIALAGRVYVFANAEGEAIEAGDLLTTSSIPGHVMKVTDFQKAQGAIIGKALTGLENGRGLVLTLVSLQ